MKKIRKIVVAVSASTLLLLGHSVAQADGVFTASTNTTPTIEASEAPFHVGGTVMACGTVVEIKRLSKMTFLNLDKRYPSQNLSILIWSNNVSKFQSKFGDLGSLVGDRVCAFGEISMYKSNIQMKMSNENLLKVMK